MKKILAVDDEYDFLFTIRNVLESFDDDYEIMIADSGIKCLELLKKEVPDLILLDIMMPDINGWDLFRQIRQMNELRNIPIIFISAVGDRTSILIAKSMANEFIEKPFTANELKNTIEKILNKEPKHTILKWIN